MGLTCRWGVLGTARIARRFVDAARAAPGSEVAAVASRSIARAEAFAATSGLARAWGSYEALLADPAVDAVYVALPNALHREWTVRAAAAGKHVLCEKPLACTADEARAMVEACRSHGVRLAEAFAWQHHPLTAELAAYLPRIGPVRTVIASFTTPFAPPPDDVRMQAALGGGALLDLGCYPVGLFDRLFGRTPQQVSVTATFRGGVDVSAAGWMRYGDDQLALFDVGFDAPYRGRVEVVGQRGTVRVENLWFPADPPTVELDDADGPRRIHAPAVDAVSAMIADFQDLVPGGPARAVPIAATLAALLASARDATPMEPRC